MAQEQVDLALAAAAPPSALVDFLAGTAGGIASLLASHPFDTVKTRLQAQHASPAPSIGRERAPLLPPAAAEHHYRGAIDAFRVIVKEEKVVGLYKGVTSPLLGVALMNAAIFGTYSLCLQTLLRPSETAVEPTLTQTLLAGCGSGVLCAFVTAPIDLIKIQEQMDFRRLAVSSEVHSPLRRWFGTATMQWRHTCRTVSSIWTAGGNGLGGARMLYRGLGITALRDLGYGPYFFTYELVNRWLASRHGPYTGSASSQLSAVELALSGAFAGCIGWTATFPLDVVKTRMQAAPISSAGPLPGLLASIKDVYRDGGARAFFRGLGTTLVRAVPANAALFVTFEATKSALSR